MADKFEEKAFLGTGERFFEDAFVQMGYIERLTVKILAGTWFVIQASATGIFLLTDVPWLFWVGVLSALFLLDRGFHYGRARHSFLDLHGESKNLTYYLTPKARKILASAHDKSLVSGGLYSLHLIRALVETSVVKEILSRLEVSHKEFVGRVDLSLSRSGGVDKAVYTQMEKIVVTAYRNKTSHQKYISMADIFGAMGTVGYEEVEVLFEFFEIDPAELRQAVVFGRVKEDMGLFVKLQTGFTKSLFYPRRPKHRIMNRAWTARPTPLLDSFSIDLTDLARVNHVGFLVGHDEEYTRLVDVLSRPSKPNTLLVGEPGVGKQAIVEHLAYMIGHDSAPPELLDKRVVMLDIGALVSGADQASIQGRARGVFSEIEKAGNVILFISNIDNLLQTGVSSQLSAGENILPMLTAGGTPVVGSTTPSDFKQFIERNNLFKEAFEVIRVEEVTAEEAGIILAHHALALERRYKVKISFKAVANTVRLAGRYFREKPLPTSAIDLLQEVIIYVRNRGETVVDSHDVVTVAEKRVNVPIHETNKEEAESLLNMEKLIHERYVDQEEAVSVVANALRQYRSGLHASGGPIGTFLFVGPTGVGKTELAKILADIQFGSEKAMVRFDMTEFQEEESIQRFIGSPDGSVSGALTDAVRREPYSLILLDEFEKAHRNILKLFLQVFDDGRLTDGVGRTVSFENTIIIATSNAEASFVVSSLRAGKTMVDVRRELMERLVAQFSPELMNRFSGVVIFKSLSQEDIEKIAYMQLGRVAELLKAQHNITLEIDSEISRDVARLGYDNVFGARPLARVISDRIIGPLSTKLLKQEISRGAHIKVRIEGENLGIYEVK